MLGNGPNGSENEPNGIICMVDNNNNDTFKNVVDRRNNAHCDEVYVCPHCNQKLFIILNVDDNKDNHTKLRIG